MFLQGESERKIEVFVKIQEKNGGGRVGGSCGGGLGGWVRGWVDMSKELKFL